MIKIILNKEDLTMIDKKDLKESELNYQDDGKIELILDESNFVLLEKILKSISLSKKDFLFETKIGWVNLNLQEILYIESFGNEIIIHTHTLGHIEVKHPLYQLEELLKPYHIIRIGKSFLVNLTKIVYITSKLNAKLGIELVGGIKLEVTRSYVKPFKDALGIGGNN